jgi:hypothetical protein
MKHHLQHPTPSYSWLFFFFFLLYIPSLLFPRFKKKYSTTSHNNKKYILYQSWSILKYFWLGMLVTIKKKQRKKKVNQHPTRVFVCVPKGIYKKKNYVTLCLCAMKTVQLWLASVLQVDNIYIAFLPFS